MNSGLIKTQVQVEESLLAEVSIKTRGTRAQVQVKPGAFSQVRPALETFQNNLFYGGSTLDDVADLAARTRGVRMVYKDVKSNRVYLQVDNGSASPQWVTIRKGKVSFEDADFYLTQLDDTAPDGLGWYNGRLSSAPELHANGDWIKIVRNADDAALKLESVNALPTNPRKFTVHFADEGRTSQVIVDGDNILLQATDPILNESQLVSRNFLYDSSKVKQISSLQRGSLILDDGSVLLIQGEQKLFLSKNFLDELATTRRPVEPYIGNVKIGTPVELANQQKFYPLTIGDDMPVVVHVAQSADDVMAAPYLKDISKPLASGNQSITIITGRSASIRIRQSQVIQASEPGTTFAYLYELDEGGRLGIQIGSKSVELNVSWETLLDDLNQYKVPQPLVSAMKEVDGQIILVADSKLDKAIRVSNPAYVAAVDQPTLVTVLDDQLNARVFSADDVAVAKANLVRLAPMDIGNTAIVIDTPSLTSKQAPLIESMVETIRTSDIAFDESQIVRSMDKLPDAQNIILITAENDAQLAAKLALKGEAGELRNKFVLVAACGNESVCSFVTSGTVKQYGATGFGVFRDQIYAETLPQFVPEILKVAKANPGLQPDQVITTAVGRLHLNLQQKQPALMEWLKTTGINSDFFREGLERLRNIFFQMSRTPTAYL